MLLFLDEREDIQKKAFTKWINNQLEKVSRGRCRHSLHARYCASPLQAKTNVPSAVTDLFQDLRDGVVLLRLLEVLTGNDYVGHEQTSPRLTSARPLCVCVFC